MMRTVALLCMFGLWVASSTAAQAVPLTEAGAATTIDLDFPSSPPDLSDAQTDAAVANASNVVEEAGKVDRAEARARAVVGTDIGASSVVSGVGSPLSGQMEAVATARYSQQLTTTGIDPGVPFNVNPSFSIDGLLFGYASSTTSLTQASVEAQVSVFDDGGESVLFDGSARLISNGEQTDSGDDRGFAKFELERTGNFVNIDVDTTPVIDPTGVFGDQKGFTARFDTTVTTLDAVLTQLGEVFAVELWLRTRVRNNGLELAILSDFLNTASLDFSVTTVDGDPLPDVRLVPVAAPDGEVPAPTTLALLTGALLGTLGMRRRREKRNRSR